MFRRILSCMIFLPCSLSLYAQQEIYNLLDQNQAISIELKKTYVLDTTNGEFLMITRDKLTNLIVKTGDPEYYVLVPGSKGFPGIVAGSTNSYYVNPELGWVIFIYDYDKDGKDEMIHFQDQTGKFFEVTRIVEDSMNLYELKYLGKTKPLPFLPFKLIGDKLCYYSESGEIGYLQYSNGKWLNRQYKKLNGKKEYYTPYTIADADQDGYPEFYCSNWEDIKTVRFDQKKVHETVYPGAVTNKDLIGFNNIDLDNELEMITIDNHKAAIYKLTPQGSIKAAIEIAQDTVDSYGFEALNLDADPEKELIFFGPEFSLFDRQADGSYIQIHRLTGIDVEHVYKGDVNGDWITDLVISSFGGIFIIYGNKLDQLVRTDFSGHIMHNIMQIDVNNDGKKDLLFIEEDYGEDIAYWLDPAKKDHKWQRFSTLLLEQLIKEEFWK